MYKENEQLSTVPKYVRTKYGATIRATKQVNVVCGDCNVPFEKA